MLNFLSLYDLSYFSHIFIIFVCVFIVVFVFFIFTFIYFNISLNTFFPSHFLLEYFWTLIPVILVLFLFVPLFYFNSLNTDSCFLFYFFVGNQWFWDFFFINDSCSTLFDYDFNFISTTFLYIPSLLNLKFFFTSNDVLHAFSLPILYIMIDLVPGVIHSLSIFFPFVGVYTVYCAQICGLNHSAMPFYIHTF